MSFYIEHFMTLKANVNIIQLCILVYFCLRRLKLASVVIHLLCPLIAAEATSFVIATKEAKAPSCCSHLTAAPAPCWPGRNSGPLRFFG
jgi:hypothetical protein